MAGIAPVVVALVILVALMVVAAIAVMLMTAPVMVIAVQSLGLVMDLLTVKIKLMAVT